MYALSAAHTLLPLPSYARVTNVANGKSVVVRVNDRGPFHEDRLIDLSYAAAHRIGIIGQGSAMVEVQTIIPGSGEAPAPVTVPVSSEAGGIFVQLGAFSAEENADAFLRKMRMDLGWLAGSMQLHRAENLYKVRAGPYPVAARPSAQPNASGRNSDLRPCAESLISPGPAAHAR
jgi:rare lipoprotein A